jgi:hypothetical protein
MVHKRVKKAISKLRGAKKGDRLPDLPGPDPLLNLAAAAAGLTPIGRGVLMGYMLAENTERLWGPPVEAHARKARDWFTSESIDPGSPWTIPEGWGYQAQGPIGPPAPEPVKRTRKVTKANKATKMAWDVLTKGRKGKLTKSACQKLLKKCSMMASKANPNTKSRIGKAKNKTTRECRKIRRKIWGTTKRY